MTSIVVVRVNPRRQFVENVHDPMRSSLLQSSQEKCLVTTSCKVSRIHLWTLYITEILPWVDPADVELPALVVGWPVVAPVGVLAAPVVGPPVVGPPVVGALVVGPPVEGPPVVGPPVEGPAVVGAPVVGPPVVGAPVVGPPVVAPAPVVLPAAVVGAAVVAADSLQVEGKNGNYQGQG